MRYLCTLLKEMPGHPVGTTFKVWRDMDWAKKTYSAKYIGSGSDTENSQACRDLFRLIDNPEWIKAEVAVDTACNLVCPTCGETRAFINSTLGTLHSEYVRADDCGILLEYVCGHKPRRLG